jgi:hypothetical protein
MNGVRKLEKIGDITYLFWGIRFVSPDRLQIELRPMAARFSYVRDVLVIRRIEFEKPGRNLKGESPSKHDALFIVAPIYRSLAVGEREEIIKQTLPELSATFFCHYFLVNFPKGPAQILSLMDKGHHMITFEKRDKKIFLSASKNFTQTVLTAVRERMA